jgi:hypothetical protein
MSRDCIELSGQWVRSVSGEQIDFVSVPGCYPPMGECDLETEFTSAWDGGDGRIFLCTEGVLSSATFFLNGQQLGTAGPWATYRFEVPRGALAARNTLRAHVRDVVDDFGPTPGRRFDAGLIRRIWIERRPAVFLEDILFRYTLADDLSQAQVTVAVELSGKTSAAAQVSLSERGTGRVVARGTATADAPARFTVEAPRLWSPRFPNLYQLTVALPGDQPDTLTEMVGFRKLEARQHDFYLNNQRLILKGVCRHEFTAASGYSPSEAEVRRELELIRHSGFNYIRLVHSPHAPCVCRIAAEVGIFVSEEPGTCFHNLADEKIYAPAFEVLRRTVKRDRNVPSIFAWLIYNECDPNTAYAVRAAAVCREMAPESLLGMADCSGKDETIKEMVKAGNLSFYGINVYGYVPLDYCRKMEVFTDRPLVITEWGGTQAIGNPRTLKELCDGFVYHSQEQRRLRIAGCSFWAWADYEERSRPEPYAIDGVTIEGLVSPDGRPKSELHQLSMMCFDMDHPPVEIPPAVEVICPAARRKEAWRTVDLGQVGGDQTPLEQIENGIRRKRLKYPSWHRPWEPALPPLPRFGRLMVDGIEFCCRDHAQNGAHPLLLGKGREEVVIPINARVASIAVLGHVAINAGYPPSSIFSVHHRDAERSMQSGMPAAEYEFMFADGSVIQPLRHGMEILRSNDICRWWVSSPRAAQTRPAVRCVIDKAHEILRLDLWELPLPKPRELTAIRWRLLDSESLLAMYALSVCVA